MSKHEFIVSNMNCNGCVSTIQQALEADTRIRMIDIKLSKKRVSVEGEIAVDEVAEIIQNSGFTPEVEKSGKGVFAKLFSNR